MSTNEESLPDLPPGLHRHEAHYLSLCDSAPMVWIPEGPFYMGQPADEIFAKPHELPGRDVWLPGYFIDVYPVTNRQFFLFTRDRGYDRPELWTPAGWEWRQIEKITAPAGWSEPEFMGEDLPAAGVSWYEADAYARWAAKRLPTEAEWEKAARGDDHRRFPWGNSFPTQGHANFDNQISHTTPVGYHPQGVSPYGCHDMAGNVNNWCQDWYWEEFYAFCAANGINRSPLLDTVLCRKLDLKTLLKVDRGGGFATSFQHLEVLSCTDKVAWPPAARNLWNGVRCVVDPPER